MAAGKRIPTLLDEHNKAEAAKRKEELKHTVHISKLWMSGFNSVGGREVYINFTNKSNKTIKYLDFGIIFRNAVGDPVTSGVGIKTTNRCSATGPFAPGKGLSGSGTYWGLYY